jgi:hypothetical protein
MVAGAAAEIEVRREVGAEGRAHGRRGLLRDGEIEQAGAYAADA